MGQQLKPVTYGDAQAIKVLVGSKLNLSLESGVVDTAKRQLSGEKVQPMILARLDGEAAKVHNHISEYEARVKEANRIASEIATEYGFNW